MSKKILELSLVLLGMILGFVPTIILIECGILYKEEKSMKPIIFSSSQNQSDVYNRYMLRNCLIELETEKGGE